MTTLQEFIDDLGITISSEPISKNPYMEDAARGMHHYQVTLSRGELGVDYQVLSVPFSMGSALPGPPTAEDVLGCLASDASTIENTRDFEEWTAELGYDEDSRRAERTYSATMRQTAQLEQFLGPDAYETLLYHVERL